MERGERLVGSAARSTPSLVVLASLACALVGMLGVTSAGAGTTTTTTVAPGTTAAPPTTADSNLPAVAVTHAQSPTMTLVLEHACYFPGLHIDVEPGHVEVEAGEAVTDEVVVHLALSGPAVDGEDLRFVGGSPTVVIPAGERRGMLEIEPLFGSGDLRVPFTLQILEDPGYEIGPSSAARLAVQRDGEDPGCGPPTFSGASSTDHQEVLVGESLQPLVLVPWPTTDPPIQVVSGELPPGVDLRPDGIFLGAPTSSGTWSVELAACTPVPPTSRSSTPSTCADGPRSRSWCTIPLVRRARRSR